MWNLGRVLGMSDSEETGGFADNRYKSSNVLIPHNRNFTLENNRSVLGPLIELSYSIVQKQFSVFTFSRLQNDTCPKVSIPTASTRLHWYM